MLDNEICDEEVEGFLEGLLLDDSVSTEVKVAAAQTRCLMRASDHLLDIVTELDDIACDVRRLADVADPDGRRPRHITTTPAVRQHD